MKVQSLPEYLKAELRKSQHCAVWAAGPVEVVSKRLGDNQGCRPIKLGIMSSWNDAVSPGLNSATYAAKAEVLFRVWCGTSGKAKMLLNLIEGEMDTMAVPMRQRWRDLGPELNLARLEKSIRALAKDFGIWTWSDSELRKMLSDNHEEAKRNRVQALRRGAVF